MTISEKIRALTEEGLAKTGLSGRRASMMAVKNDGLVRDIRNGRQPSPERLDKLFKVLGVSITLGVRK